MKNQTYFWKAYCNGAMLFACEFTCASTRKAKDVRKAQAVMYAPQGKIVFGRLKSR